MRPDPLHPNDEDRVDALWDRLNGTQNERSHQQSENSEDTIDYAAISLLASMVPTVEEESLARIRQKFEAGVEKETTVSTVMRGKLGTNVLPHRRPSSSSAPNRLRQFPRNLNWIAAAVLVMAVVGSAFMVGPGRGLLPEPVEHQLAAFPGFSGQQSEISTGEGNILHLQLSPASGTNYPIEIGVWEITLPGGTGFQIPSLKSFGPVPFALHVVSGSVSAGSSVQEKAVGTGNSLELGNGWEYVRNVSPSVATIWVMAPLPWDVGAGFDFHFSLWTPSPDMERTPENADNAEAIQTRERMRVPVQIEDGRDVEITLGLYNVGPDSTFTDLLPDGTRSIHVANGQFDVIDAPAVGTPVAATTVRQGQNYAIPTGSPHQTYQATGSEKLRILTVSVAASRGITLRAEVKNCHVAPLTPDDLRRLAATPIVRQPTADRSLLHTPGGTAPDEATATGVLDMLKSYVECAWSSKPGAGYTFFSDEALRDHATEFITDLKTSTLIDAQGIMPATVSEIRVFDDGRVGVRLAVHGENAYLTLVQQGGVWKIDVWDDSGSEPGVLATPQS